MPDETNPTPAYDNQYEQQKYAIEATVGQGGLSSHNLRNPPVRKLIEMRIMEHEAIIKALRDALDALNESPATEKVLNTLRKLGI